MSLKHAFKSLGNATKSITNIGSNIIGSGRKTMKGVIQTATKPLLYTFFPVAGLIYLTGDALAKKLPWGIGQKYETIHKSTIGQLEDAFSIKKGRENIKSGIVGDDNYNLFDENAADAASSSAKETAKAELEKIKLQHAMEMEKLELQEQSKSEDRRFELEKTNNQFNHDLAINEAGHTTTRHGVEQNTAQKRIEADGKIQEKTIESGDKRHESTENRLSKEHEVNQITEQERLKQGAEQYKADQERSVKEHEANQKLEEKRVESSDKQYEASQTTEQEKLRQDTEKHKTDNTLKEKDIELKLKNKEEKETTRKEKEEKAKAKAKEEKQIIDIIAKANILSSNLPNKDNAEKNIEIANKYRNELATIDASHAQKKNAEDVDTELTIYIEMCQQVLDENAVSVSIQKATRFISDYTTSTGDLNLTKLNLVKLCDKAIQAGRTIADNIISPSSISTKSERNKLQAQIQDLDNLIRKIEEHKEDNLPSSTPNFSKPTGLQEPQDIINFKISKNTKYIIELQDLKGNLIEEFDGNSQNSTSIHITPSTPLTRGKYNIVYKTENAFGSNDSEFSIEVVPEEIKEPNITITDEEKANKTATLQLDNLNTEELNIFIQAKGDKNPTKYSKNQGDTSKEIALEKLKDGLNDVTITITDKNDKNRKKELSHQFNF